MRNSSEFIEKHLTQPRACADKGASFVQHNLPLDSVLNENTAGMAFNQQANALAAVVQDNAKGVEAK